MCGVTLLRYDASDNSMGCTLHCMTGDQHNKSTLSWAHKFHTGTCASLVLKSDRKKTFSWSQLILTRRFVSRGQIDLINYSSMPDGELKNLITPKDYGIKISQLIPLTSKNRMGVAMEMLQIFYCIPPPPYFRVKMSRRSVTRRVKEKTVFYILAIERGERLHY